MFIGVGMEEHQQLVSIDVWAERLNVCRRQVEFMLAAKEIPPPIRIGKLRRWSETQIDAWIKGKAESAQDICLSSVVTNTRAGRPRTCSKGVRDV